MSTRLTIDITGLCALVCNGPVWKPKVEATVFGLSSAGTKLPMHGPRLTVSIPNVPEKDLAPFGANWAYLQGQEIGWLDIAGCDISISTDRHANTLAANALSLVGGGGSPAPKSGLPANDFSYVLDRTEPYVGGGYRSDAGRETCSLELTEGRLEAGVLANDMGDPLVFEFNKKERLAAEAIRYTLDTTAQMLYVRIVRRWDPLNPIAIPLSVGKIPAFLGFACLPALDPKNEVDDGDAYLPVEKGTLVGDRTLTVKGTIGGAASGSKAGCIPSGFVSA